MLVTADWVLPVHTPPLRHGGVLVDGERIVAVGPAADLASHPLAAERHDFGDRLISPGLVNAHTHLTLTALAGVVPSMPFAEWLPRLVAALKPWEIADHEASGVVGAEQCLRAGVTVVGDIAYGAAEVARATAAGLGGVYYWELLGIRADQVDETLEYLRYPATRNAYGERAICGLSAHSPYTSGPELLEAVHAHAAGLNVPTAIHVAESLAELQLLADGTGPLAATAERTAFGFTPPRTSTARYLDSLGVLEGETAVHLCHIAEEDLSLLARTVRGAVTCPRSNRYLHNPPPRIAPLLEAGIEVGIGTDSSASNRDLDLMEELRALHAAEPEIEASQLLRIVTAGGARAIGVEEGFGTLASGGHADLAVFDLPGADDPATAFVESAGASSVIAVLAGGQWRVEDGSLLMTDAAAHERARKANEMSRRELASL